MSYTAEISRSNPSCFLFLIDQSGSMQDVMDPTNVQAMDRPTTIDGRTYTHTAQGRTKAQFVVDAINKLLQNIVLTCARTEGIRDYYQIGVIGYGTRVGPAFSGTLAGRELVNISEVAATPARIEERVKKIDDGAGDIIEQTVKFPVWFDPVADGGTPMCKALNLAHTILANWLPQHVSCFPPTVINITDGESTDGDPSNVANKIKQLSTADGEVLLLNVHVSALKGMPMLFPNSEDTLPDQYAQLLFRNSSQMPEEMRQYAQQFGYAALEGARGFGFNAHIVEFINFLKIGTRPSNLR